jgi:hypothetical protein
MKLRAAGLTMLIILVWVTNANAATANNLPAQVGGMPLTTEDIVRLVLENNRDVMVTRLSPISSFYAVASLNRLFEPNFHVIANVNRANSPSRSQLTGAPSLVSPTHDYRVGIDQTLQTGTAYSVDFDLNRSSGDLEETISNCENSCPNRSRRETDVVTWEYFFKKAPSEKLVSFSSTGEQPYEKIHRVGLCFDVVCNFVVCAIRT